MSSLTQDRSTAAPATRVVPWPEGIAPVVLPRHIGIIMDGNGRWATGRSLPRVCGHEAGAESIRDIVRACGEIGIEYLTLFAFSTENWKRPVDETDFLMTLLKRFLISEREELHQNNVSLHTVGKVHELPQFAQEELQASVDFLAANSGLKLTLALNYGGREEIADAAARLAQLVHTGKIQPHEITAERLNAEIHANGLPDPDLIVRTAGEMRLSNFLLWQASYAEYWSTEVCWPDFRRNHLCQALTDFAKRKRKFGALL
ncbi:MAG TPA: isoprenyl transferase [Planctomycetota bacterium]|nr:isoprenyl transferase [Planctomycetota bacterium]